MPEIESPLQLPPATPPFSYPIDPWLSLVAFVHMKVTGKDPSDVVAFKRGSGSTTTSPKSPTPDPASPDATKPGGVEPAAPAPGQACTAAREQWEYQWLANTYVAVVARNLAAGWVWGPQGNAQITIAMLRGLPVPLGSCSDWQLDIHRALCNLPVHCWQICKIRSVWHKAVVVYPKSAWWWRRAGLVFDPWFLGGSFVYTVGQWFLWAGLNRKYRCCK